MGAPLLSSSTGLAPTSTAPLTCTLPHCVPGNRFRFCTSHVESEVGGRGATAAKVAGTSREAAAWKQVLGSNSRDRGSCEVSSQAGWRLRTEGFKCGKPSCEKGAGRGF